ncbi:tetratricopeptide repeat protein [PVC group bacterium]|nr:tetratricopeptide repeat protein [PVC group bacterium]
MQRASNNNRFLEKRMSYKGNQKMAILAFLIPVFIGMTVVCPQSLKANTGMHLVEKEIQDYLDQHYTQAITLYRGGALEAALIEFQKVQDINPNFEQVQEYMANVKKGILNRPAKESPRPSSDWISTMDVKAKQVNMRAEEINIYTDRISDSAAMGGPLEDAASWAARDFLKAEVKRQRAERKIERTAQKKDAKRKRAIHKAKEQKTREIATALARGENYYDQKQYEQADKAFNRVLKLDPNNRKANQFVKDVQKQLSRKERMDKAEELFRQEKYDLALVSYENILKEEPGNDKARQFIREIQQAKVQYAMDVRQQTMKRLFKEGQKLYQVRQYDMAINIWEDTLSMGPQPDLKEKVSEWIRRAEIEKVELENVLLEKMADIATTGHLSDVIESSIPSTQKAPDWARQFGPRRRPLETALYVSPDKQKLLDALAVRYTVEFNNASILSVIETLSALTGLNIIVDTRAIAQDIGELSDVLEGGAISIKVKDLPLIELLDAALRFTDLRYMIEENMIWITTQNRILESGLRMVVFDVSDLIRKIHDFPSDGLEGVNISTGSSEGGD